MRVFGFCLLLFGCGETKSGCTPGASVACACTDGNHGAQTCLPDGTYSMCECLDGDPNMNTFVDMARPQNNGSKRVFVTSTKFDGSAVKDACVNSAAAAGLGGIWDAWLSTGSKAAIEDVAGGGPWKRLDGMTAFNNRAQLATSPLVPLDITELNTQLDSFEEVWTGTNTGGRPTPDNCLDWGTNSSAQLGTVGRASNTSTWTNISKNDCGTPAHVYCFER